MRVVQQLNSYRLQGTSIHKFLGLTVDVRFNGVAQANATVAAFKGPSLAIRPLTLMSWGSLPRTLLHLHDTLVVSRICYN